MLTARGGTTVRRATREDLPRVAALHKASILQLCAAHYTALELSRWTDALRHDGYAALLASREFLVAEEDDEILGFGVIDLGDSLINATYVRPDAAGRGVGRRLIEEMEGIAIQNGASRLRLRSTLNAVPFYERLGFVRQKAAFNRLPTGIELPCILMTKDLESGR
jgi:putative acetyltransferase